MDDRFPKPLRWVVNKLDFIGLPNLGALICGLAVLGFIGKVMLGAPLDRFVFDPYLFLQGEWWRIFAYPVTDGSDNPIWLLFYVLYVYFVMGALEAHWGPGPLTVYTLFAYICAILGAFLAGKPVSLWFHVLENVSLAFGTLFPEVEFLLFFILPVKAKWLALFAGGLIVFQFISGDYYLVVTMIPYLLFFGPVLYKQVRLRSKVAKNRKKFDKDMWK